MNGKLSKLSGEDEYKTVDYTNNAKAVAALIQHGSFYSTLWPTLTRAGPPPSISRPSLRQKLSLFVDLLHLRQPIPAVIRLLR